MSAAVAGEVERLSAADSGGCPSEVAAAKAQADEKGETAALPAARSSSSPVRSKPTVRGADAVPGNRLQAPRWHSFLPGMFR